MMETFKVAVTGERARTTLEPFVSTLVVGLAVWTATRTARYVLTTAVMRFHVESITVFFIAAGLFSAVWKGKQSVLARPTQEVEPLPIWNVLLWLLLALVMYFPAIWIGFLSDDFVLVDRAVRWDIGPVTPQLFRPIPLLLWGTVLRVHGGAVPLHLLNVLLHGTNSYLTSRIIRPYVQTRSAAVLAGLVVVTFPLNLEAVVWASGVFDVMATTWVTIAVLIAREYGSTPSRGRRFSLIGCGVAALLSKETAAILPVLIVLDIWAIGNRSRTLLVDVSGMIVLNAAVGVGRLYAAPEILKQPLSMFMLQRWVFDTFGSSAMPWHANMIERLPFAALVSPMLCLGLLTAYFLQPQAVRCRRAGPAMALWMLVSTLPVITIIGVSPDLEGSRYMYLPSIGWAGLLAWLVSSDGGSRAHVIQRIAILVIIVTYVVGVRVHFVPWQKAAALRDHVERVAVSDSRITSCQTISISKVPDNIEGAYVLRNGIVEAFARDIGIEVSSEAPRECSFVWNDDSGFSLLMESMR
jgi:hypothetical protein